MVGTLASGVNVGGGSSNGTSVTETQSAIEIIPPHGTITMPQRIIVNGKGNKVVKNYEYFEETLGIAGKQYDKKFRGLLDCLKKMGFEAERDRYYGISEICEFQGEPELAKEIGEGKRKDHVISRVITYSTEPEFSK